MTIHHRKQNRQQDGERFRRRSPKALPARAAEWVARRVDPGAIQHVAANPGWMTPGSVHMLQRAIGNRAVTRLIQPKLMVGPVGDHYEQEADRVSEQVLSMPSSFTDRRAAMGGQPGVRRQAGGKDELRAKPLATLITPLVQRQEDEELLQGKRLVQRQEEEELQMKPTVQRQEEEELLQGKRLIQRQEEEELQMKPTVQRQEEEELLQGKRLAQRQAQGAFEAGSDLERRLAAGRGGGTPLPDAVRTFMEPRFGVDFSGVRAHTGGEAVQLNNELSAQAFTHGQDIYFGAGQYDPRSSAGKRLLAHELTHVVQQTSPKQLNRDERPRVDKGPKKIQRLMFAEGKLLAGEVLEPQSVRNGEGTFNHLKLNKGGGKSGKGKYNTGFWRLKSDTGLQLHVHFGDAGGLSQGGGVAHHFKRGGDQKGSVPNSDLENTFGSNNVKNWKEPTYTIK